MENIAIIAGLAYLLDLFAGDPLGFPHPVRLIGFLIERFEPVFRKAVKNKKIAGALFALFIVSGTYIASLLIISSSGFINKKLALVLSVILMYTTLSVKSLKIEALKIYQALKAEDLPAARKNLSMIVSRDTSQMDKDSIIRAAIESVAENTVDGIIAPLFFAFTAGVPMAMAFKAVSTLDSMVGYKNEKYRDFGFFSAKMDDLFNYIPARISAFIMPLAGFFCAGDLKRSVSSVFLFGNKNPSPNSGIPEAAMAGALGVRLGGGGIYHGRFIEKDFIGEDLNRPVKEHILKSVDIVYITSALAVLTGIIFRRFIV
ncbi:MAG: cobalamin biosynthesis protein CobD [Candidatus Omnitrophica bacterium]|nr:cobalamin biosynthesis protein CobD [Candidatus Omnitrophota bacterium]